MCMELKELRVWRGWLGGCEWLGGVLVVGCVRVARGVVRGVVRCVVR